MLRSSTPPSISLRHQLAEWCRQQKVLRTVYSILAARPLRARVRAFRYQRLLSAHTFARTEAWDRVIPAVLMRSAALQGDAHGANIVGYLRGEFGLAESARMYARALIAARVPVALYDLELGVPHSMEDASLQRMFTTDLPERVVIIFINPDYFAAALSEIGKAKLRGKYIIACWFWELEHLPATWLPALEHVDELLVASGFIGEAVRRSSDVPLLHAPIPLAAMDRADIGREAFAMKAGSFTFLVTFDFNSWIERKNPQAAIRAFREAFPRGDEPVQLLIKTSNGHLHAELLKELVSQVRDDPRILIRNDVISRQQLTALQASCDAYVSLHRAEGFGMGLAECMQLGKPVIATGWSGNMEFMHAGCAALVGYELVPIQAGQYPFGEGQRWAEPDVAQAARWMARLASDPSAAARIGELGRLHVEGVLSPARVVGIILARLSELNMPPPENSGNHQNFDAQRGKQ